MTRKQSGFFYTIDDINAARIYYSQYELKGMVLLIRAGYSVVNGLRYKVTYDVRTRRTKMTGLINPSRKAKQSIGYLGTTIQSMIIDDIDMDGGKSHD